MIWKLAIYPADLPDFPTPDPLLQYTSWNFRDVYASLNAQSPGLFPRAEPLQPPVAANGAYDETGTLLAGSGRHLLVTQDPGGAAASLTLTGSDATTVLPSSLAPFVGVVRIR